MHPSRQAQVLRILAVLSLTISRLCAPVSVAADADAAWWDFVPGPDRAGASAVDLRFLNERVAGESGWIQTRGPAFVHPRTQQEVRFWGVNGPSPQLPPAELGPSVRRLARYGVNLARLHGAVFDEQGRFDSNKIGRLQATVGALKAEGIYAMFSIYFPLWMKPAADHPWLKGYDGGKHPFAALMFQPDFQEQYRGWWRALLLTPDTHGRRLIDDPAVFALEVQNEDSFFFWTFHPDQIPAPQLHLLERRFGDWARTRYGSLDAALRQWNGLALRTDAPDEGRLGFRPLWNLFSERTPRDRDTARFLFETQRGFYQDTIRFLRELGYRGLITASNWSTASPEILGPLEKWSYTTGDFLDRHGYFSCLHEGDNAAWSIRAGHTYLDRSALRFDPTAPGKPREFVHPAMDITYAGKPSMISETTWNRPNRFRSEAPLFYAAFGALQGTDAIVHFALDGSDWSVKPGYWMQPWTLMSPSQMAQFPAAALLYRRGLVRTSPPLAVINLDTNALLELQGTPLPQEASFDELRLKDVPAGGEVKPGQRLDPLLHFAGATEVNFTGSTSRHTLADLKPWIDRAGQQVRAATGELHLDYRLGVLRLEAPAAQGVSGNLRDAGSVKLPDLTVESSLDLAHVMVVSLDHQPLSSARRMLVQVMSEERANGFATEEKERGVKRITDIGRNPWQVRRLQGQIRFTRGATVQIQPLDLQGFPTGDALPGPLLELRPSTLYYLVTRPE